MEDIACISSLTRAPTASISCSRVRAATSTPGEAPAEPGIGFVETDRDACSIASARRLLDLVVTAGPRRVSLPLEELAPPRFVFLGMTM